MSVSGCVRVFTNHGATKTNHGATGFHRMHAVLRVLILCARTDKGKWRSDRFVQTIICQLCLFNNARAEGLPTWKLLQQNLSMFNEAPATKCHAVLGRAAIPTDIPDLRQHIHNRFLHVRDHQQEDNMTPSE